MHQNNLSLQHGRSFISGASRYRLSFISDLKDCGQVWKAPEEHKKFALMFFVYQACGNFIFQRIIGRKKIF